jgi:hypothetical protein
MPGPRALCGPQTAAQDPRARPVSSGVPQARGESRERLLPITLQPWAHGEGAFVDGQDREQAVCAEQADETPEHRSWVGQIHQNAMAASEIVARTNKINSLLAKSLYQANAALHLITFC